MTWICNRYCKCTCIQYYLVLFTIAKHISIPHLHQHRWYMSKHLVSHTWLHRCTRGEVFIYLSVMYVMWFWWNMWFWVEGLKVTKCSKVLRAAAEKISSQLGKGTLPSRYWQFVLLGSSKTSHLWYTRPRTEFENLGNLFGCFSYFSFSHFDVVSQIDTTAGHWTSENN